VGLLQTEAEANRATLDHTKKKGGPATLVGPQVYLLKGGLEYILPLQHYGRITEPFHLCNK